MKQRSAWQQRSDREHAEILAKLARQEEIARVAARSESTSRIVWRVTTALNVVMLGITLFGLLMTNWVANNCNKILGISQDGRFYRGCVDHVSVPQFALAALVLLVAVLVVAMNIAGAIRAAKKAHWENVFSTIFPYVLSTIAWALTGYMLFTIATS